ncbi:hypothetical protein Agabi119p4_6775 [Agaricus bisporus var. burnettii]|uniref:HAT C-terminal dimerisation domain-containing protein n=1 Tax=Agaricus bisporus var. burnettii TaxID=192524 RepID=A0A8H7CAH7_AGABI|nr:hypothetical protein Agabi119p4_6775 [Agaricus bisporus var. burnettii]
MEMKKKRKRTQRHDISSSDEESSEEDSHLPKRRKQPTDIEEIVLPGDSTEEELEVVGMSGHEGSEGDNRGNETEIEEVENDGLNERHIAVLPIATLAKTDSTRDLMLVFSDRKDVRFKDEEGAKTLKGRWCTICREKAGNNIKLIRKSFHVGSNSSCRQHIRQHYDYYSAKCKEEGLEESEHCVPRHVLGARKNSDEKKKGSALVQGKLDKTILKGPRDFTREGILKAVTIHIATDDQAFDIANKPSFRNCLVTMRPRTTKNDLPSAYDVKNFLHSEFTRYLQDLADEIKAIPGNVAITSDGWTADTTSCRFLGLTAHWIKVEEGSGKWMMRSFVIGLRGLSGNHSGKNLGQYVVGLCDRVGLIGKEKSKLSGATLDNASSNTTVCKTIAHIHKQRKLADWNHHERQFMCLAHVVNLANIDIMKHITNIAVTENKTAIWEFNPALERNWITNGGLDVIAALRTLAIKIQASPIRIEYFNTLQVQCGIPVPLKIPLHSNVRWGTAHAMLDRAHKLCQVITLFVSGADERYGPITTIRKEGEPMCKIPWTAFSFTSDDWQRVADARDILADSNVIQQNFSTEHQATLWRALPLMDQLKHQWENRRDGVDTYARFSIYSSAIQDGLNKIEKYYSKFSKKPAYLLALILHPYYKIDYIETVWGGEKKQQEEREQGNHSAKNWKYEATIIFEATAETYWNNRPRAQATSFSTSTTAQHEDSSTLSEFDRRRQALLKEKSAAGGEDWRKEVRTYLGTVEPDVSVTTDIVVWWQDHAPVYPTLARIALDVLPIQASAVPCERLFSASKQVATDRRSRLGSDRFEELLVMKSAWWGTMVDWAAVNTAEVEEVDLVDYVDFLEADKQAQEWEEVIEISDTQSDFE